MFNPNRAIENLVSKKQLDAIVVLLSRVLLAYIFIVAGFGKITAYEATGAYMEAMGVPSMLLPLTILVEFGGGLAILFGFQTRLAALGLAIFSVITALIFHGGADDVINLMKNMAIAGGLLMLVQHGASYMSLDQLFEKD